MIEKLQGWYRPVLEWVLARYKDVITGAVSLFCMSAVAFHFLGGEFIPSLEKRYENRNAHVNQYSVEYG